VKGRRSSLKQYGKNSGGKLAFVMANSWPTAEQSVFHNIIERRQLFAALTLILAIAFLLRLYFALTFPNVHHPDEVFQYLEQAHRLVFNYGVVPWEYRDATRSWLVPGFLAGLMESSNFLNLQQPASYLVMTAAILSAFSLSIVLVGFLWAYRTQGLVAGIITATLCCVWFELIYFAPKTLTEPIATNFLIIAVYLAYPGQPTSNKLRLLTAGLLFGLAVMIRANLAPAVFVAAIYICRREFSNKWVPLALGGLVTLVLVGILDAFTWQYPFQSFISNIWINVVQKRSETFGIQPWYYFAGKWALIWGGAIVPMAIFSALALRKNLLLGLIAVTIIATHMFFAHKEYRFVFPAVPFVIILVGLGTAEVFGYSQKYIKTRNQSLAAILGILFAWVSTSTVLAVNDHFRTNWFREAGNIHAFDYLRDRADLCGVGILDFKWFQTAGYTHLHRNVPIIIPPENIASSFPAYNYAIAIGEKMPGSWPYSRVMCWNNNEICVYRRAGLCDRKPDLEVNEVLRRQGE